MRPAIALAFCAIVLGSGRCACEQPCELPVEPLVCAPEARGLTNATTPAAVIEEATPAVLPSVPAPDPTFVAVGDGCRVQWNPGLRFATTEAEMMGLVVCEDEFARAASGVDFGTQRVALFATVAAREERIAYVAEAEGVLHIGFEHELECVLATRYFAALLIESTAGRAELDDCVHGTWQEACCSCHTVCDPEPRRECVQCI